MMKYSQMMANCSNNHAFQTAHALEVYSATEKLWSTPIFESRSFVVLPTVGALLEGWLLVIPRTKYLCFAHFSVPLFSELELFLNEIVPIVERSYGPISVFEHGPSAAASPVGCGVDYAHLHLVPAPCDLHAGAREIAPNIQWHNVDSLRTIRNYIFRSNGYWFVQQPYGLGNCKVGTCSHGEPPSQLFRRVIATSVGHAEAYDWKETLGEAKIAATVTTLAQHAVCG